MKFPNTMSNAMPFGQRSWHGQNHPEEQKRYVFRRRHENPPEATLLDRIGKVEHERQHACEDRKSKRLEHAEELMHPPDGRQREAGDAHEQRVPSQIDCLVVH